MKFLKSKKFLIPLALLLGTGGWYWFAGRKAEKISYQFLPVTRGSITQTITATGAINPVLNVQVGSQISGIIQELFADFNTPVKEGQIVAKIDAGTYEAIVMQAEGELASAKAHLELETLNLQRNKDLRDRNAISQATLDQSIATVHQAEAAVKVREGSLARARVDMERCTIYSPIDGIVISRDVDVGQTVAASLSAPVIFTIANDLAKMQIHANVAEADVGNLEVGQKVEFTVDAYPTRTFIGTVTQIRNAATVVQNVVSYDTVIEVNNDDLKLKPGMTATVTIIIAHRDEALRLGGAAFRYRPPEPSPSPKATTPDATAAPRGEGRRGGGRRSEEAQSERTVYVLRDGKPTAVQVRVGISDGINTEIIEGLNEGDEVIIATLGVRSNNPMPTVNPMTGGMRFR